LSNSKAQLTRSIPQLLREMEIKERKLAGEDRINFTGINSTSTPQGGSGRRDDEPNVTPLASFLRTAGDTMVGALAFYPTAVTISSGAINISRDSTSKFSTYVIVSGEGAADDTLATITGAAFSGQIIYLQPILTNQITLTETGGNFILPGGTDVVVNSAKDGRQVVKLIFDVTVNANKWTLVSNSAGGGGVTFPITPTVDDREDTWTGSQNIDLSSSLAHVTKFTLDQDLTITLSNIPTDETQIEFEIELLQDGTGGHSVTFPTEVVETITISTGANTLTIVTLRVNDGANVHAITTLAGTISGGGGSFLPLAGGTMSGDIVMDGNDIDMVSGTIKNFLGWTNAVGQAFVSDANGATWALPTGDAYLHNINGLAQLTINETQVDVHSNTIVNFPGWTNAVGQTFVSDANGSTWSLPVGDAYLHNINGLAQLTINETEVNVHANDIILDADADSKFITSVDDVLTLNLGGAVGWLASTTAFDIGAKYSALSEIAVPGAPSSTAGRIFLDSADNTLKIRKSSGTVSLEGSGGANTALSNLASVAVNISLVSTTDGVENLGTTTLRWGIGFLDRLDIQDDLASNPANSGITSIEADQGGMNLGVAAVSDVFDFYFGGGSDLQVKEDGELQFNTPGRQHKIVPQATSFDIVSENQADEVELWSGSGRTNASLFVGDGESVFASENDVVTKYDITIQQRHTTPAAGRVIGDVSWEAENTSSALTEYATIEGESSVVTAGAEQGRLRFGVQVNSVTGVVGIELIGVSTALRMGFFGTTPVIQQSVASDTLANLYTALRNYGWIV